MKLAEAIARFLDQARIKDSTVQSQSRASIHHQALRLLAEYFSKNENLSELTPSSMRDFLSRYYVEKSAGFAPTPLEREGNTITNRVFEESALPPAGFVPEPISFLDSIEEFIEWAHQQTGAGPAAAVIPVLNELRHSLPRAVAITNALAAAMRASGGAFTFPEFLTSFEEGGSSRYDIDIPGAVGAIDGYFRIIRVESLLVEAEELISEKRLWPIAFPAEVADVLDKEYIINLELVRNPKGWRIAGCGFAYPPGTEVGG